MHTEGKIIKRLSVIILAVIVSATSFSGCAGGKFETVQPPIKEFPTANEFALSQTFIGTLTVKKSFTGNKIGSDTLYLQSDTQNTSGFSQGEKGFVSYSVFNNTFTVNATLVSCPTEGVGEFIVKHEDLSEVPEHFPGTFWIDVMNIDNCLMIEKKAVKLINDDGAALVYQVDENGFLTDKQITVGVSNNEYYQVLDGLSENETVVLH